MRETDIARTSAAALLGILLLVCVAVLGSWWAAAPAARARPPATAAPAAAISFSRPGAPAARRTPPAVATPAPAAPAAGNSAPADFEREAFRLRLENARLRGRLDDMLNWMLDNVRGTFPLPENQMVNLRLVPVETNMAVSADLVQLLRLDDREIRRLDSTLMGTRGLLRELETENISVAEPAENQVVLNIPPFPEEGQVVREELHGALKKTLGSARYDRFMQVAAAGLEEKFEHFGEVDRTLEFAAVQDDESGAARLFVRDERVLPAPDDPYRQDITASVRVVSELPDEYYPYWNWLPDYVTRFARNN